MGNNVSSASSNLGEHGTYSPHSADKIHKYNTTPGRSTAKAKSEHHRQQQQQQPGRPEPTTESSRLFFLLYLLHRTWNVVKDKGKGYGNRSADKCENVNVYSLIADNACRTRTLTWEAVTLTMTLI